MISFFSEQNNAYDSVRPINFSSKREDSMIAPVSFPGNDPIAVRPSKLPIAQKNLGQANLHLRVLIELNSPSYLVSGFIHIAQQKKMIRRSPEMFVPSFHFLCIYFVRASFNCWVQSPCQLCTQHNNCAPSLSTHWSTALMRSAP